jgi:DNA modification methylase
MNFVNKIYTGDALEVLKTLPNSSVDCCVTSPPYYGLRDYGVAGQIGLEDTPEAYIARLLDVFREVYKVLKPAGTLWLNIGDSYAGSGRGKGDRSRKGVQNKASFIGDLFDKPYQLAGYKNKDLIGIPWQLAFALRADGWYLRQDIIWHKPNPMPESINDRCTKAHEYIFLLTKSARYYFDYRAIMEPAKYDGRKDTMAKGSRKYAGNGTGIGVNTLAAGVHERWPNRILAMRGFATKSNNTGQTAQHHGSNIATLPARHKRSVWSVPTRSFRGAHFATYPEVLIIDCLKAGCPEGGTVLDPFFGSGTTGIVARKLNRNYIGIELSQKSVSIARQRLYDELGCFA